MSNYIVIVEFFSLFRDIGIFRTYIYNVIKTNTDCLFHKIILELLTIDTLYNRY